MTNKYKATGTIRFSVDDILEETIEDARARFQHPAMLESELMAADEQNGFELISLEIEDLGPCEA